MRSPKARISAAVGRCPAVNSKDRPGSAFTAFKVPSVAIFGPRLFRVKVSLVFPGASSPEGRLTAKWS